MGFSPKPWGHENYTKCYVLFGIMQCYIYLLYISYFTNKSYWQIGSLDIIERS